MINQFQLAHFFSEDYSRFDAASYGDFRSPGGYERVASDTGTTSTLFGRRSSERSAAPQGFRRYS